MEGRTTRYTLVDELQCEVDRLPIHYNVERGHHGSRLEGRTPVQALKQALGVAEIPKTILSEGVSAPLQTAAEQLLGDPDCR